MTKFTKATTSLLLAAAIFSFNNTSYAASSQDVASSNMRQISSESRLSDGSKLAATIVASSSRETQARAAIASAFATANSLYAEIASENGAEAQIAKLAPGGSAKLTPFAFELTKRACLLSAQTSGNYDVTAPSPKDAFLKRDCRRLSFDDATNSISTKSSDMKLDLKRIAKGAIADRMAAIITEAGFQDAMASLDGIQRNVGRDIHTPWRIQIQFGKEEGNARRAFSYEVTDAGSATITADNIGNEALNPATKEPIKGNNTLSCTVIGPDAATSAAFALAAYTLGPKYGTKFIESHREIRGVMVASDGTITASKDMTMIAADSKAAPVTSDGGPNDLKLKQREEEQDK